MAQPHFNSAEFGDAEADHIAGYRAKLLAQHEAPEPDDDADDRSPGATLIVAILAAISGAALMLLVLGLVGWVR